MNKTIKWLTGQLPGIIITAVISWIIAVSTIQKSEPEFVVDAIRSVIIDRENLTDQPIRILKTDGTEINKDLVTATFYFYNSGQKPIVGKNDIINNLKIILNDSTAEIINFKILKASRNDIGYHLYIDTLGSIPRLGVNFKILEKSDGFTGQLTYIGRPDAQIKMEGSIVGKQDINEHSFTLWDKLKIAIEFYWVMGGILLLFSFMYTYLTLKQYKRYKNRNVTIDKLNSEITQQFNNLKQELDKLELEPALKKFQLIGRLSDRKEQLNYLANPLITMGLLCIATIIMGGYLITKTINQDTSGKEREIIMSTIPEKIKP